jgi:hypothetical protein
MESATWLADFFCRPDSDDSILNRKKKISQVPGAVRSRGRRWRNGVQVREWLWIMKCSVFPVILCCCLSPACYAQGGASVLFSGGQAQIVDRQGQARAALRGAELALGETVDAAEGRVQLLFRDGAQVSLQAADSSTPRPLNPTPAGAGRAPLTTDLLPQKKCRISPVDGTDTHTGANCAGVGDARPIHRQQALTVKLLPPIIEQQNWEERTC